MVPLEPWRQFKSPGEDLLRRAQAGLRTYRITADRFPRHRYRPTAAIPMEQPLRLLKAMQSITRQRNPSRFAFAESLV